MPDRKRSLTTRIADAMTPQVKNENSSAARNDRYMSSVADFANSRSDVIAKENLRKATEKKAKPSSFKYGGKVKKTGMAKVHRGERVLTRSQSRTHK